MNSEEPFCHACAIGKTHRLPFPSSDAKTTRIGEIIHANLCGPMQKKKNQSKVLDISCC